MNAPRVTVVMGTRPEIIKLAPVLLALEALGVEQDVVFTGQHYDPELTEVFFRGCGLRPPATVLEGVGGADRVDQITASIAQLSLRMRAQRPGAVVVQGDTNSANAGAQAAHYLGVPVVHVEAGLRSNDRAMPEEVNRLLIGALADVHCCATAANAENLLRAGTPARAVHVTGNPIVEATRRALPGPVQQSRFLRDVGVEQDGYVLATVHRPENTDDPQRLRDLLGALGDLGLPVLLPLHPRTRARLEGFGLAVPAAVRLHEPVGHTEFLSLAAGSRLVVSDSGGVQEEVTVLGKPLVVVRNSTERPEAVDAGFSVLTSAAGVREAAASLLRPEHLAALATRPSPFGDGRAGLRIAALTLAAALPPAGSVPAPAPAPAAAARAVPV
ncbi:non-hydrolyzing UDP-N-acetylglucosamine 2-epimerase [Kineococcus sp. SYSU DK005]|uniref:non-hydrolyzing UDP-N-acetylglucosamine 2-epimerase n=1 Tax=Kineococcus sp. SYSU DK005 TaxID=3383126 RepID=UPI003D7C3971